MSWRGLELVFMWCCLKALEGYVGKGWEGGYGGQSCWLKVYFEEIMVEFNFTLVE